MQWFGSCILCLFDIFENDRLNKPEHIQNRSSMSLLTCESVLRYYSNMTTNPKVSAFWKLPCQSFDSLAASFWSGPLCYQQSDSPIRVAREQWGTVGENLIMMRYSSSLSSWTSTHFSVTTSSSSKVLGFSGSRIDRITSEARCVIVNYSSL